MTLLVKDITDKTTAALDESRRVTVLDVNALRSPIPNEPGLIPFLANPNEANRSSLNPPQDVFDYLDAQIRERLAPGDYILNDILQASAISYQAYIFEQLRTRDDLWILPETVVEAFRHIDGSRKVRPKRNGDLSLQGNIWTRTQILDDLARHLGELDQRSVYFPNLSENEDSLRLARTIRLHLREVSSDSVSYEDIAVFSAGAQLALERGTGFEVLSRDQDMRDLANSYRRLRRRYGGEMPMGLVRIPYIEYMHEDETARRQKSLAVYIPGIGFRTGLDVETEAA